MRSWYVCRRQPFAEHHLYCFPHAGGGVETYLEWQKYLAPAIEVRVVQLPGRGALFSEPLPASLDAAIAQIVASFDSSATKQYSFFGHSLGALLAYEVSRTLSQAGGSAPQRVIVSGSDAPHKRSREEQYHLLPDDEFVELLKDFEMTSDEALNNPDMRALILPIVRSDFALAELYEFRSAGPMNIPITVLSGDQDEHVDTDSLSSWGELTTADCHVHLFPGGHFFFDDSLEKIMDILRSEK